MIFNINLLFWGLFYALSLGTQDPINALFYIKTCFIFITLIPYLTFRFCAEIADYKASKLLKGIQIFIVSSLIVLMPTSILIKGVKPFLDFKFVPDFNWAGYAIPLYFSANAVSGLFILYQKIKTNLRIKYIFLSTIVGFTGGATNFFPYLGIPIYPLGNIFIAIYCVVLAYLMIKHRLYDSSVMRSKIIVRGFTFLTLGLFYFVLKSLYYFLISNESTTTIYVFHTLFLILACESYQLLMNKFQEVQEKVLPKKSYEYGFISKKLNQDLSNVISLDDLQEVLKNIFETNLRLNIKTMYIIDKHESDNVTDLSLLKYWGEDLEDDLMTEMKVQISFLTTTIKYGELPLPFLQAIFDRTDSSCYIPFVVHERVLGFILVRQRSKNHYFSYNDMILFDNLTFQVGSALDRIKLHNKVLEKERVIQEEKSKVLRSLGGSIAHEMRNPLNAINMIMAQISDYLEELSQENISSTKEKISELTHIADNSISRTNKIINITLNELKGQKPDISTFVTLSSISVIKNAVNEYGYKNKKEKGKVIINAKEDFLFKGDETILIYVLFNLIKNALYYLNEFPDSTITLKTETGVNLEGKEYNVIYVRDTGPGIPQDRIGALFADFSTSGKKDGTGLGLAFCLRTMKSFGGNIKCFSELGKYTEFVLYFPKLSADEISEAKESFYKEGQKSEVHKVIIPAKKILIVDDEQVNIMIVKALIENNFGNLSCDVAKNGQEAVELFEKNKDKPYDLILMDLQMPIMNGLDTTKEIRKVNSEIPIVAYTSRISRKSKEEASKAGVDNYLIKPSTNKLILKTVAKWLRIDSNISYSKERLDEILKDKQILIADDQQVNLMMLSRSLGKYGLKVDQAQDGQELYDKYISKEYSLIIADINMPNMTGGEVAKKIREYESLNDLDRIPMIAYSGDDDKDLVHRTFRDSIDDFFVKSAGKTEDLAQMIAFWLTANDKIGYYSSVHDNIKNDHINEEHKDCGNLKIIDNILPKESLIELSPVFIESSLRLIGEIKKSDLDKDVEHFFIASHALKGISGNLGAEKLYKYMIHINKAARHKSFPEEENWLRKLDDIFAETKIELELRAGKSL